MNRILTALHLSPVGPTVQVYEEGTWVTHVEETWVTLIRATDTLLFGRQPKEFALALESENCVRYSSCFMSFGSHRTDARRDGGAAFWSQPEDGLQMAQGF